MNLKSFKKFKKLNNKILSEKLNISSTHLSLLMNGTRKPSNKLILKILNYTNGEVDPNSFFDNEIKNFKKNY